MMSTIRSNSSPVNSPALWDGYSMVNVVSAASYLFRMDTSAFLQHRFAYRLPTPLMAVSAYMMFVFPSRLVLRTRKMCWN